MMHISIAEAKAHRQISMELDIKSRDESFLQLIDYPLLSEEIDLKRVVEKAREGLRKGRRPELCEEGVGGTYFFRDVHGNRIGVFKPQDEEPFSVNNPKGYSPRRNSWTGFKEGILVGEASLRECAAFLLDHEGFSGVPPTDLALCQHSAFYSNPEEDLSCLLSSSPESPYSLCFLSPPLGKKVKLGSLQEYVEHDGDTEDLGPAFLARFPVDEVHKIAVLDIRLCNTDRHSGNILYKECEDDNGITYKLIPIDHGYTLPSTLGEASFAWMNWPQSKQRMSENTKDYIRKLDVDKDISLLKQKFGRTIREEHFRVLRLSTMLLKKAAEADLTFYQIANIMCRSNFDEESILEKLWKEGSEVMGTQTDDANFMDCLSGLIDLEIRRLPANGVSFFEHSDDETCVM